MKTEVDYKTLHKLMDLQEELLKKYDALLSERDALKHALDVKEEFYQDALHSHIILAQQRDQLRAEVDALKKDAERYRWLRQRMVGASFDWDDEGMVVLAFEMPAGLSIGADCDKNIDAALQGAKP